ncbi:FtsX-like permease family [Serratia fonticola]|jgi:putative ABC transport system permease protein|uniref:putative ABC transporter permease subunit YbbP n=1 Tax=Serratia fonticola TaxID=47917 RepID=UPI000BFC5EE3|nr:putative ABC transporter permease subunit YbbP [Serratia fonticola]ATM74979.1 ABC transporter permease [Serratia fonticola]MBC3217533.1 ABC transporter permease [Serratia fonticola]MBC3226994.1 ABC transporter permease [Serratia fonticola]MCO7510695.1 ABC transporter permease [Serratia fonticola]NCG55029.1 FtsX-like permease family protein [Serratia fonticola]
MIWRWFWREWRSPSLLIVWLALTLSVACVLALGSISDRMDKGLSQQSRDFIAGDRVLRTARPVPEGWLLDAQQQGLKVSRQLSFTTMTYAGDRPLLANVKATDAAYPLYGQLETLPANLKPVPGSVLVAPRLLALLDIKVGDNLDVGDTTLRIAGEVVQEPDSGFNPFQTAPGIIINLADVDKTGAVQPGSRLTYRYMFAGAPTDIQRYEERLKPQLKPDQRWYGLEESGSALGKSLQRSQQFLLLSALLTLLLSIAAVAVAMSHYCRSRYDLIAVLKTLGAGRKALSKLIIGQWLAVLLLAGICGSVIGLGFEAVLIRLLAPVLPGELPAAGGWPWLWAMGALVMISLLVGLRPYRQLLATQPLRVLRRDVVANVWPLRYFLPATAVIVIGLLTVLMGASTLLWAILAGMVVLALLLGGIGWGSLLLLRRITLKNLALRLAVNRLLHQPWVTISQLAAFSLSFMLLALLLVLRGDLLDRWQQQLPPDSPNYFLLNMTTAQVPQVKAFLQQHQLHEETFYPIVRVRLSEINQQVATERVHEDDPGGEAVNRELNLTWQSDLPDHNPLTAGTWPPKTGEVSMDEGIAGRLKIQLGDTLTFSGDTQSFSAKVTSLRQVDWESLKPNFYFIFPPGALDGQPQTWLTSFRYDGDGKVLTQLNRQFPTLSLLDIGSILKQVGGVLQQVSRALEVMVVLVVICGGLLLLAQVQVGMRQRRQELVVYRTLGAGKRLLRGTLWCEFALLGLVAGIAAAVGAEAALWLLQTKVFDFPWAPTPVLWWALPLLSALLLSLCGGWLGVRLLRGRALFRSYEG